MTRTASPAELTKPFYSPAEVAAILDVPPGTILNYIADGRLYAIRLSARTIRIPNRALRKLLAPGEISPPTVVRGWPS